MHTLTFHGANRVLKRGIPVDAIKEIIDQTEVLKKAQDAISPALSSSNKRLKFRYLGHHFSASPGRIQMNLDVGTMTFVVGLSKETSHPVIVTCWQN